MGIEKEKLLVKLKEGGYSDDIIKAFAKVKKESFVPEQFVLYVYDDLALPLDDGSTLPPTSTIAFVLSLLDPKQNNKIMEIGSGSGYLISLISEIIKSGKIFGMEINTNLAIKSKKLLENDSNIEIINRSGIIGLQENAPFDRILVSAELPNRQVADSLLNQLNDPGIMVFPLDKKLIQIKKENGKILENEYPNFTFVPFRDN